MLALMVLPLAGAVALLACGRSSRAAPAAPAGDVSTRSSAANPVAVSPQPGTPDASPSTQVSFLGGARTTVSSVHVVGSRSGAHAGTLRAYSTGTGESWVPDRPFLPGEQVRADARVRTGSATHLARSSFTVAYQAPVSQSQFPLNAGDSRAIQRYSTEPALTPSTVQITTPARRGSSPGDLFLAPYQGSGTAGPMIVDQGGNLVWFKPLPAGETATNFTVQRYAGKRVLSWWEGRVLDTGFGQGQDVLYDSSYHKVATIRAGNGYQGDLHEIRITPEGTAWIDIFDPIKLDLSAAHGAAEGVLSDSIVQEIDIRTGLVMWEWHALGHVPLGDSHNPAPHSSYPWDYIHVNSVDPGSSGDVLLSARNTWAVYDLDIRSGAIRWQLGGSHSSFRASAGTPFYWQHDAEFQPGGRISLFDNGSEPPEEKQSRGLLLAPDLRRHAVTLVKAFADPMKPLLASSQGNTLSLPGGNWLVGYGGLPNVTEFDSSGQILLDATLARNVQNFRTSLSLWRGQPTVPPALLVQRSGPRTLVVSVSWNGATEVASWRVLAGASPTALSPVARAAKVGFQTTIVAPGAGAYVAAEALDGSGRVIGTSATVRV